MISLKNETLVVLWKAACLCCLARDFETILHVAQRYTLKVVGA